MLYQKYFESKYEEEKRKFENEMQKMRMEMKLSEVTYKHVAYSTCIDYVLIDVIIIIQTREEMMRDELSHKRTLELTQAQSSSTTNPVPMVGYIWMLENTLPQIKLLFCAESAAGSR